jgi:hypothetical protein
MPLSCIIDLYDPDNLPNRSLERTIRPDDPSTVYRGIQDYVLPPEVKEWLFNRTSCRPGILGQLHHSEFAGTFTWSIAGTLDRPVRAVAPKNNQYENFCAFVAETTASDGDTRQWTEIRNDAALAHALLVQGLLRYLPRT